MKHKYIIEGMTCNGCKSTAHEKLTQISGVQSVEIDLTSKTAEIEMAEHIPLEVFQSALSDTHYNIILYSEENVAKTQLKSEKKKETNQNGTGVFYCPMRCEGEKTYEKPGDCPVCGMDLVQEQNLNQFQNQEWTCPMHSEVINDEPGDCPLCGMALVPKEPSESAEEKSYKVLKNKFWLAAAFTIPIFIIAMSEMIPNNPLYNVMEQNKWNWVQFILSLPVVFYATWMFFERAYRSIKTWNLNMFTLIGIGAGAAWLFSVIALLFPDIFPEQFKGENNTVHVYFEAATVILTLVLLGQLLEARAHSRTNSAIKELLKLAPSKATKIVNGEPIVVNISEITIGDIVQVKPGEKIPIDGIIIDGESSVDESMITGEPMPVSKHENDKVSSGTINGTQSFLMKAEKVGDETLLSQIIKMVNDASRSRAPIQNLADKVSGYFVPIVVIIAILTFISWAIFGPEPSFVFAFVNAIAVLIIACPCALGLATPMSVMVGVGKGANNGVLIKNAEALETMSKVDTLIIDKTGTITEGKPTVESVVSFLNHVSEQEVLSKMVSLNTNSEHPLANAIVSYGKQQNSSRESVSEFNSITGKGVEGKIDEVVYSLGNERLLEQIGVFLTPEQKQKANEFQRHGKTVSYLANSNQLIGLVAIGDKIKATSKEAINSLQKDGVEVIMLTGDTKLTAQSVANELNLAEFKASMLPQDKLLEVEKLQQQGRKVAMAGDGINDAPALAKSDVGLAMGTGTDVAIESASITLLQGDLRGIAKAKNLSDGVMKNIKQNLFFALIYNTIGIPIAAGVLYPAFGLLLSPMIAALAMSFSSVSVIANSLRLKNLKLVK